MRFPIIIPVLLAFNILSCTPNNGVDQHPILQADQIEQLKKKPQLNQEEQWLLCIDKALKKMPRGGEYRTSAQATNNFVSAFQWNNRKGQLKIASDQAKPSYCSIACYLLLLESLQQWEQLTQAKIPSTAWQAMAPKRGQADGQGVWGWANANGPGWAVLIHQLNAGYNFTDWNKARPGDFMKMFWTDELGKYERGHLTVYLGEENGCIKFWSSNQDGPGAYMEGYGVKYVPKSAVKRVIFTRITHPNNFAKADSIQYNSWLFSLLKKKSAKKEVLRQSGI